MRPDAPAMLPSNEAGLGEWAVFADQLTTSGDGLGELMAFDLALGSTPGVEQIGELHHRAARWCKPYAFFEVGWCLGFVRTLRVKERVPGAPRLLDIDRQTSAALDDFLRNPRARRLERLSLPMDAGLFADPRLRSALAGLPPSCRTVEFLGTCEERTLPEACAVLPTTVTTVRLAADAPVIAGEHVTFDLRACVIAGPAPKVKGPAIVGSGSWVPSARLTLGGPDDAVLLSEDRTRAAVLERTPLLLLQRANGLVSARGQVQREVREYFVVERGLGRPAEKAGTFVRTGATWLHQGEVIASGARLKISGAVWDFFPDARSR